MSATQKKKLCWNCEGRVPLDSENCPYCAVYLGPAPNDKDARSVLAPPYKIIETEDHEEVVPEPPFVPSKENSENERLPSLVDSNPNITQVILPLALLSGGALFSLFGFILFLFSEKGMLNLKWNGEYWYLYLIFAFPMLIFGWKSLPKSHNTDRPDFQEE
jgi:hypothetical protein